MQQSDHSPDHYRLPLCAPRRIMARSGPAAYGSNRPKAVISCPAYLSLLYGLGWG